jgi:hypothetical protein
MPLSRPQITAFHSKVSPMLGWFTRACSRLQRRGADIDDANLYKLAEDARQSLHALAVHLHYERCDDAGRKNLRR